jgi:hypothetical protein
MAPASGRPRQGYDIQTGGEKYASKEKGKEEEVITEHLQASPFPKARFCKRALFSISKQSKKLS